MILTGLILLVLALLGAPLFAIIAASAMAGAWRKITAGCSKCPPMPPGWSIPSR